jgi:hypothetical protein
MTKDHITDAVLATPPAGAAAAVFMGMSLSTWVATLTILYTVIMIVVKLPSMIQAVQTLRRWIAMRKVSNEQGD